MNPPQTPLFKHDCDECVYLGVYHDDERGKFDGWAHFRFRDVTVSLDTSEITISGPLTSIDLIRRWSDNGPDYGCMPLNVNGEEPHPAYAELASVAIGRYVEKMLSS